MFINNKIEKYILVWSHNAECRTTARMNNLLAGRRIDLVNIKRNERNETQEGVAT